MEKGKYQLYTDGAYSMSHGEGAFAYVILDSEGKEVKRNAWKITNESNNRAELKAIIAGMYHLPDDATSVTVISDSQYALNTLSGTWNGEKNADLKDVFRHSILAARDLSIEWKWVKGHSGDKYNEICDQMCVEVLGYDPEDEIKKFRKK